MNEKMKEDLKSLCPETLFDEAMSRHTTIRIGGPADAFVYPKTVEELTVILQ